MPDPVITMSREELREIIREAVREELHDVGLRTDSPESREATREDLRFSRQLRKTVEGAASKVGLAIIMAIVGGVMLALWEGLKLLGMRPPLS